MTRGKKLLLSFGYALSGVSYALKHNQNLRIHFVAAMLTVLASIFFRVGAFEMGILGVMILLVIVTEMINTAIEQMVNYVVREHTKEAKIAKDVSAGMVLLTAVGSVIVGVLISTPHVLTFFHFR